MLFLMEDLVVWKFSKLIYLVSAMFQIFSIEKQIKKLCRSSISSSSYKYCQVILTVEDNTLFCMEITCYTSPFPFLSFGFRYELFFFWFWTRKLQSRRKLFLFSRFISPSFFGFVFFYYLLFLRIFEFFLYKSPWY